MAVTESVRDLLGQSLGGPPATVVPMFRQHKVKRLRFRAAKIFQLGRDLVRRLIAPMPLNADGRGRKIFDGVRFRAGWIDAREHLACAGSAFLFLTQPDAPATAGLVLRRYGR